MKFSIAQAAGLVASLAAAFALNVQAAQSRPLSLAEAQRLAVERSRSLAAARHAIGAAREMAIAAGQLPDPVVSLSLDNVPVEGPDRFRLNRDFMTMRRLGVMQELTRSEKRELRSERYELEARKGDAERSAALAAIQRDTAIAWLDAYYAEAMARVIAEQRVRGLQEVEASEAAYRGGQGAQADVFMTRSALAMLDDRAADLERRVKTSRTMLERWTGLDDPRQPLGNAPDIGSLRHEGHALEARLATHPEIEVLARQQQVASAEARLARANKHPDWSVELAYGRRSPGFDDMVSLGVSIPFPWDPANRQDREVAAKLALAEQAGAQREEALRRHVAEVRVMAAEWESNRSRLVRYEREIVPLATARSEAALAAYRGAKTSVNDVLAARRGELEARLQALQLSAETARLWAQLDYLFPEETK